jgi:hypothetical protein
MRAKRILLFFLASAVGAIALAAVAAFSPQVQTWAARRAVASLAGPASSLEGASAGLGRASLGGLRVEMDGAVLTVPVADARIAVFPAVLRRKYHFESLVASGWTLDMTRSRAARPDEAGGGYPWLARVFGGALEAFKVRADLSLDRVDLEGDVIFPDEAGRPAGRIHVVVTGGGIGPGSEGHFQCAFRAALDDRDAPVSSIAANAVLAAAMDGSGTFTRAELKGDARASGRQFPNGIGLSCAASAARGAGKESYSVSLIRGSERIAAFDSEGPDGSLRLAGSWRLNLKDTDLAPFALGRSLPAFYVAGEGTYELDPPTGDVHAAGKLQASADRLGVVARGLGALGRVDLSADFDVARLGPSLRVARLDTSLSGAEPVASVRALQSFEFNMSTGELKVAVPADDLVGISVKGVPLAWLKGALPRLDLSGGDAQGELVMRAEDGRLVLRTRAPLTSSGVALSQSGRTIAAGLELSAFVLADYAPEGWQLQLAPFAVRSEGIEMLLVEARFGRLAGTGGAVKAAGSWSASVPLLLSIPAASALPRLTGGDASGSFEASLGATREVRVKVALKGLVSPAGDRVALPSVSSDIRADFEAGGRTTFSMPVRLDYGMRAVDLVLAGTVSADPKGPLVNAMLSGTRLLAEDLAAISVLAGRGDAGPPAPPPADPSAERAGPAAPFWPDIRGRLSLKLEDLLFPRVDLRDVRGTLLIEPDSLSIEGGSAAVGEGSAARFDGLLVFSRGAERPYSFKATVSVGNVDSAPIFQAINPDKPPVLDGRFDIASHLTGSGTGVGDLLDRVQGDLRLSSKDGRFRALRTDVVDLIKQAPSKLVDALDTVTALFSKKSENMGTALVESAKELSDIHYDQMSVSAERGADLDLRFTEITLLAPEERLSGKGVITYSEGVPIRDQPLSIDLDMGVRGHLGKFLDLVGMLKEGQDELGYAQLYQPIHLGGTLRSVDQSQWRDMLVQAPLRKGSGLIDKLLGK